MVINIKIEKRIATYIPSDEIPVCGSNLDTVKFTFDKEWDAYPDKFARFIYGTDHHDEPIDGDTCKVPMFINITNVLIGVFVGEPGADEDCLATTNAEVEFKISARCTNTVPSAGTIKNYTSEAQEYAAEARVAASDAEEWAVVSKNAANRATESAAYVESVVNDARDEVGAVLSPQVDQNTMEIADNREEITILDKRVTNLEQGITPAPFVTDTTGKVPVNALPYAEVVKVGGMTYRDEETNTLKTAKPTSIESRGANLIPFPYSYTGGTLADVSVTIGEDGGITMNGTGGKGNELRLFYSPENPLVLNGTYTISSSAPMPTGSSIYMYNVDTGANETIIRQGKSAATVTLNGRYNAIRMWIASGTVYDNITFYPMLNAGGVAAPYKLYREDAVDTLEIPEAVQNLDGYGLGINADCYNYVDWEKKQFVSMVASHTFTGTETVSIRGQNAVGNNVFLMPVGFPTYYREKNTPMLISGYNYKGTANAVSLVLNANDDCGSAYSYYHDDSGTRMMYFVSSANSVDVFLADLAKKEMQYKLVEPIMTDISDLLPDDNFIEVEGGGTIVAVNAENLEAPTEIRYQTKEV